MSLKSTAIPLIIHNSFYILGIIQKSILLYDSSNKTSNKLFPFTPCQWLMLSLIHFQYFVEFCMDLVDRVSSALVQNKNNFLNTSHGGIGGGASRSLWAAYFLLWTHWMGPTVLLRFRQKKCIVVWTGM